MDDFFCNEVFAFELVNHVFILKGFMWFSDISTHYLSGDKTTFDCRVGDAVSAILDHKGVEVYECYAEMYDKFPSPTVGIGAYAFQLIPDYFPRGFSGQRFLHLCALLIGVSILFFEVGKIEAPDAAAEVIATILRAFTLTGDFRESSDFTELISESNKLLGKLKKKKSTKEL